MFSIRQGDWKLCVGLGSGGFSVPRTALPKPGEAAGQLYNIAKDPTESDNLFLRRFDVVGRLSELLQKYQREGRSRS